MATNLALILGGTASGKSRLAERLAEHSGQTLTYLATAVGGDSEMREKIRLHQVRRGPNWSTIEEPIALPEIILRQATSGTILIDCLTIWVANLMAEKQCPRRTASDLMETVKSYPGSVVMVSGETGMGIIPDNALSRQFANELGQVNQLLAIHANLVLMSVAGRPLTLKGNQPEWL